MWKPLDRPLAAACLAGALAVLAAACTGGAPPSPSAVPPGSPPPTASPGSSSSPGASPTGATGPIAHPTGANDLVLRFDEGGGFVMPAYALAQSPWFSLYGDGTVVYRPASAAPPEQRAGDPMRLPALQLAKLTEDQVQALLRDALGAGGLAVARAQYENQQVADAPTAVFTVNADGRQKQVRVYALGIGADASSGPDAPILAAMAALGERLRNFDQDVAQGKARAAGAYLPTRFRASLLEGAFSGGPPRPWPWPTFGPKDFTTSDPSGIGAPSRVLSGVELSVLGIENLEGGVSGIDLLGPDGKQYSMAIRPLLPDELR